MHDMKEPFPRSAISYLILGGLAILIILPILPAAVMGAAAPQTEKASLMIAMSKLVMFGILFYPFVWIKCLMTCRAMERSKDELRTLVLLSLCPLIYLVSLAGIVAIVVCYWLST
jgi:Kef-type K+ transport system membrane component KefB